MSKKKAQDFRTWKAKLMKTLALLHAKTTNPEEKLHLQRAIDDLRYLKSRDISTIIYILHELVSKYGRKEIIEFIETAPVEKEQS